MQTIRENVEIPQVQFLDKVVEMSVMVQCQVPMVQTVWRTVEVSQNARLAPWVRQLQQIIHDGV